MNSSTRSTLIVLLTLSLGIGCTVEPRHAQEVHDSGEGYEKINLLRDYVLYRKTCVGFQDRAIPSDTLTAILETITPYMSISRWRLVAVCNREKRIGLLSDMQAAYRKLGKERTAKIMERWKPAPVVLVFCAPSSSEDFGGVPGEIMRPMTFIELGMGVQSLMLMARAYGIETHWIASALMVDGAIKEALGVVEGYDVAFFGVAGYPSEEIEQEFPPVRDVCFMESWGNPIYR